MFYSEQQLDDLMEQWHTLEADLWEEAGKPELHEFLGWTQDEYFHWGKTGQQPN